MFGGLFRKRSSRSLDELIFEIAEHDRAADFDEFYARMQSHAFYMPLTAPLSGPPGSKIAVGSGVLTKYIVMRDMKLFVFFTTDNHPKLGRVFGGIEGSEALRMTLASPEIDGALFQNAEISWIGLDKQKCQHVLNLKSTPSRRS
jgi:hypothetical protein